MVVTIAGISFDHHDYDERGDTLYLSVGAPREQAPDYAHETPEGHVVEYDEQGAVVAIELTNARDAIERNRELTITLPSRPAIADSRQLAAAIR